MATDDDAEPVDPRPVPDGTSTAAADDVAPPFVAGTGVAEQPPGERAGSGALARELLALDPRIPLIVGVGASAGGLEPIESFFNRVPTGTGISYVLVQHLSPDFKSFMKELLARQTALAVARAEDGMVVEPDTVYLIPPKKILRYTDGRLAVSDQDPERRPNYPIDELFESLGDELGERAVAVVLSGTGTDGSRGIQSISDGGGLVLVQDPETTQFDGMPRAAIATGFAHYVNAPAEPARIVADHAQALASGGMLGDAGNLQAGGAFLSRVVGLIRRHCSLNLAHYKPGTMLRRISRRMLAIGVTGPEAYLALLERSEEERTTLRDDLLIGVTRFLRDPPVWEHLRRAVLPALVREAAARAEFRAWVAGCSSGQEAYTVAMLVDEALRAEGLTCPVKIFATDIDKRGLEVATRGRYDADAARALPEDLRSRYLLEAEDGVLRVHPTLRENVIFAQHDMTRDAPFTRMDFVSCRNVLIYMQPSLQQQVLESLHFSLRPGGVLVLGSSETLGRLEEHFDVSDARLKLFRRGEGSAWPSRAVDGRPTSQGHFGWATSPRFSTRAARSEEQLLEAALRSLLTARTAACVIVNEAQELVRSIGDVGRFLRVPEGGRTVNLGRLLREPLALPVSSAIHRALREDGSARLAAVPVDDERVDVEVHRLQVERSQVRMVAVVLSIALRPGVVAELDTPDLDELARERIGSLEHELQQTRESLQATIEELETTNEEQQATNEELLAANEELQSTNEELQSVNEELYTVNSEYQAKIDELTHAHADIDNLLASAMVATLFVDRELRIRRFTPSAVVAFNLLPHDVGRPLGDIASKIVEVDFAALTGRVVETGERLRLLCRARDGHRVAVGLQPYVTPTGERDGAVLNFFDLSTVDDYDEA